MFTPAVIIYICIGLSFGFACATHLTCNFEGSFITGLSIVPLSVFFYHNPSFIVGTAIIWLIIALATGGFTWLSGNGTFGEGFKLGLIPFRGFFEMLSAYNANTVHLTEHGMGLSHLANPE